MHDTDHPDYVDDPKRFSIKKHAIISFQIAFKYTDKDKFYESVHLRNLLVKEEETIYTAEGSTRVIKDIDPEDAVLQGLVPGLQKVPSVRMEARRARIRNSMDIWKMLSFAYPDLRAIELSALEQDEKTTTDIFAEMRTNVLRLHLDFVKFNKDLFSDEII